MTDRNYDFCKNTRSELITSEQRVSELLDEVDELESKIPRWISVEERLPEDEDRELTSVLGWNGVSAREVVFAPRERSGSQWSSAAGGHEFITHWMPLPEPPEVK
jgi:hypothetical protein